MEPEQLLRRVRELEEEVKRLREKLHEDAGDNEGPAVPPGKGKTRQQRPFNFGACSRRHVALKVAYLGWGYQGFASQENTRNTVEEKLFEALTKTRLVADRQSSNYHRCGRTDKGVSAFGQVGLRRAALGTWSAGAPGRGQFSTPSPGFFHLNSRFFHSSPSFFHIHTGFFYISTRFFHAGASYRHQSQVLPHHFQVFSTPAPVSHPSAIFSPTLGPVSPTLHPVSPIFTPVFHISPIFFHAGTSFPH